MVAMLAWLVVAAIAAILAAGFVTSVLRAWRRRQRDELRSIGSYHERLDTLHVAVTDRGGSVRLVAETEAPPTREAPGRPRVTPWAFPVGRAPVPLEPEQPARHGRTWALGRSHPRHRLDTQTVVIALVTALVVGALALVGVLLEHRHAPSPPRHRAASAMAPRSAAGYAAPAPRTESTNA